MEEKKQQSDIFRISHILILVIYTLFSAVLIAESAILDWETWPVLLIIIGIATSWWMHISHALNDHARLWFYAVMMMAEFFFYGIHTSSLFDMSVIMAGIMMIYGMTGVIRLVTFAQATYFVTFFYDIFQLSRMGVLKWDPIYATRIIVHAVVIIIIGYIVRLILHEWENANRLADDKISDLRDATHRMDDFLVNVSHEIRTPVNAVIGLTSVMLDDPQVENNDKKELSAVNAAGHRIAEQIGDILDYTEIDMDKLMVTNETYMMSSILNDLVTDLTNTQQTELELIIDVDPNLPKALSGDAVKIKKILRHLIVNGIKFTKSGGVYVHIYPQRREYGINLCIEVRDTGDGIEESEIEHIFENFYQTDSGRARTTSGLGLGTSIVNGFVREMGGFLTIDSHQGSGTSVSVSIPQRIVDDSGCMSIDNRSSLCIASLLRYRSFVDPQIREFYNELIMHLTDGLNLPFYQAESMDNLRDLVKKYNLTHVFIGAEEYMAEPSFYENIGRNTLVVVVADDSFAPRSGSKIHIMKKPFYCFPVIQVLEAGTDMLKERPEDLIMSCPGLRALVVDDEPMNLIVAEGIFNKYGMDVTVTGSGMDAITLCKANTYDIIFMDHMMPEMDGIEAMRRIRAIKPQGTGKKDTLFIALTANVISSARNMFLSEGFDGFVAKPIETIELERVLKRLLPKSAIRYTPVTEAKAKPDTSEEKKPKEAAAPDQRKNKLMLLEEAGLDTSSGLSYCQNDPVFYDTILKEYGTKAGEKITELQGFYDASDWGNYTIRIHALKSTSKMIGANTIFEQARDLEAAAKAGDVAVLKSGHGSCMSGYRGVSEAILSCLG